MKRALVAIKASPHYRRDAFETGLKRLGYTITHNIHDPRPGDAFITWNLTGVERLADRFRHAGAAVVVTENAYVSPPGTASMYALSRDGHCGAGRFPAPSDSSRLEALGVNLQPWRSDGKHILVAMQRGIGSREMASPHDWHNKVAAKIQTMTKRPVKIRQHPGNKAHSRGPALADDLRNAWAVVVWSSTVGVHALAAGVPVFYAAPHWICAGAALPFSRFSMYAESPMCDDSARLAAFVRMAWGQWHYSEIATGEPLKGVLEC